MNGWGSSSFAARRLAAIVVAARASHPFYRDHIADPARPPVLDRATALANNDALLAGRAPTGTTSGSTGVPIRFVHDDGWRRALRADVRRFVAQLGGPLPVSRIVHAPGRPAPDTLDLQAPLDAQLAFIQRRHREHGAVAVTTYPTQALLLARAALDRGVDLSFVRRFGMYAESVEAQHLAAVRVAFPNARVWTTYSAMEVGLIAASCPYEAGFHHVSAHRLGVEILRDDGAPAGDGEVGHVVITDYLNRASPFIRYAIGDLAAWGTCPCGRVPLPALRVIHGKVRGALVRRDGERVLFADLSVRLRDIPGVRQYQVVQRAVDAFTVRVVADADVTGAVRAAFVGHFGYLPAVVEVEPVAHIPRGTNGKFHASVCEVPETASWGPTSAG